MSFIQGSGFLCQDFNPSSCTGLFVEAVPESKRGTDFEIKSKPGNYLGQQNTLTGE